MPTNDRYEHKRPVTRDSVSVLAERGIHKTVLELSSRDARPGSWVQVNGKYERVSV